MPIELQILGFLLTLGTTIGGFVVLGARIGAQLARIESDAKGQGARIGALEQGHADNRKGLDHAAVTARAQLDSGLERAQAGRSDLWREHNGLRERVAVLEVHAGTWRPPPMATAGGG